MNSPADQHQTASDPPPSTPIQPPRTIPNWTSHELLGEATEARIVHGAEVYRLLKTRNDKLILVK